MTMNPALQLWERSAQLGLSSLCCVAVGRPRGRILGDARLRLLSGFVIALVLIAEVGGFGSLFNVFVVHEFRVLQPHQPLYRLVLSGGSGDYH